MGKKKKGAVKKNGRISKVAKPSLKFVLLREWSSKDSWLDVTQRWVTMSQTQQRRWFNSTSAERVIVKI